jgi:hypothetical protein
MGRPEDRAPTGVTEGRAYQMLLVALVEAAELRSIPGFSMTADE